MQLYSKRIQYFYLHLCVKCMVNSVSFYFVFSHVPCVFSPQSLLNGMNSFLESLDITFRRDPNNFRPRINKLNSVKVSMYSIMLDVHCNILLTWRMSLLAIIIPSGNLLRRGYHITAVCVCVCMCVFFSLEAGFKENPCMDIYRTSYSYLATLLIFKSTSWILFNISWK